MTDTEDTEFSFRFAFDDLLEMLAIEHEEDLKNVYSFICVDCKVYTGTPGIDEYYMVENDVWDLAGLDSGMLCIGCLEERLGRSLVGSDFIDVPINQGVFPRSARMLDRLSQ